MDNIMKNKEILAIGWRAQGRSDAITHWYGEKPELSINWS
jgi:hypothetical protein